MVTVPTYQRTETDGPILQQGLTTLASGDDSGVSIARGIQQVAAGIGEAGASLLRVEEFEDTTRAKEADNALAEWSRNAMYGVGGYSRAVVLHLGKAH